MKIHVTDTICDHEFIITSTECEQKKGKHLQLRPISISEANPGLIIYFSCVGKPLAMMTQKRALLQCFLLNLFRTEIDSLSALRTRRMWEGKVFPVETHFRHFFATKV